MSNSTYGAKVGVFGRSHGDIEIIKKVIKKMYDEEVDELIINGDLLNSRWGLRAYPKTIMVG